MGLIQDCKPILFARDRMDLLFHVRKEIVDLKASFEASEEVPEVTAEMVVDSLMVKFPEKIVLERKIAPIGKKYIRD